MKIAYDHQIFSSQRFGGISRYFFELAKHLAGSVNDSVECQIVSPIYVNDYLQHASHPLRVLGIHAPVFRGSNRLYRPINKLLSPQILKRWRPDILHETYYCSNNFAPRGCRTVVTVYDMIHELYPENFSPHDKTSELKRAAVTRADHIVCISENTRHDLIRLLGVPAEKTTVVHLGFALTESKVAALPLPRKPFLLYVGSRGGYKNFDRLLEAYADRPSLHGAYDLVAFGGGSFSAQEQTRLSNLGLHGDQVRQIGGDDTVLAALYLQATLFVYPSLYEGFGIPPLEAMSFNCPVSCSNTSSIPEVVGDAAVLFDPHQSSAIADALEVLTADVALQRDLRQRGLKRIQAFSWQQCATETLGVYRKVLQ